MQQLRTFLIQNIPADVSHFELYSGSNINNLTLAAGNVIPDKYGYAKIRIKEYRRAENVFYQWKAVDLFGNKSDFSDTNVLTIDGSQLFDKFVLEEITPESIVNVYESNDPIDNLGVPTSDGFRRYKSALKKKDGQNTGFSHTKIFHSNQEDNATIHENYIQVQPAKTYPGEKIRIFWRAEAALDANINPYPQLFNSVTPISLNGVIEDIAPNSIGVQTVQIISNGTSGTKIKTATYEVLAPVSLALGSEDDEWLFNENGGAIAASENSHNLTISGTPVWGPGSVTINAGSNVSNHFNTTGWGTDVFSVTDSFSVAAWVTIPLIEAGVENYFFNIGNGTIDTPNWSLVIGYNGGTAQPYAVASGGVFGVSEAVGGATPIIAGQQYLFVVTYDRVGGSNNNILRLRYTADGSTWTEAIKNDTLLMHRPSSFELRSGFFTTLNTDATYHKLTFYSNKVLDNSDMQEIFDAGAEGALGFHINFTADTYEVFEGDPVILTWDAPNATDIYIDNGIGVVSSPSGTLTINPTETSTFTAIAHDSNNAVIEESLEIKVKQRPVINTFTSEDATLIQGQTAHLTWSVSYASKVEIDQGIGVVFDSGSKNTSNILDSIDVSPSTSTTYTLTATNKDGDTITANFLINIIEEPEITLFEMSPKNLIKNAGDSVDFNFNINNATDAELIGPDTTTSLLSLSGVQTEAIQAALSPAFERTVEYKLKAIKNNLVDQKSISFKILTPEVIFYTGSFENPDTTLTDIITAYSDITAIELSFNYIWANDLIIEMTEDPLLSPTPNLVPLTFDRTGAINSFTGTFDFSEIISQADFDLGQSVSFKFILTGPRNRTIKTIIFDKTGVLTVS